MLRLRHILFCLFLFLLQHQLEGQVVGQPNMLFGESGGTIVLSASEQEQQPVMMAPIEEGGFYTARSISSQLENWVEISRFGHAGNLDPKFADQGLRKIVLEGGICDVEVKKDSSLFLCGYVQRGRNRDVWIMHILKNGKTDPEFGIQGVVTLTIREQDVAQHIVPLEDGGVLIGGTTYSPSTFDRDIFIVKLNEKGRLNQAFGERGSIVIDLSKDDRLKTMELRPDGRVVLAGNVKPDQLSRFCVMRILLDGKFDLAFGNEGSVILPIGIGQSFLEDMKLLEDGSILVGGNARMSNDDPGFDLALVRLLPEGQWDPTFGDNGVSVHDLGGADYFGGMAIQNDQHILIAGISGKEAHIFRIKESGARDQTYGKDGSCIISSESRVRALNVVLDQQENLLVGISENTQGRIFNLFGNPHLPGLDKILAFNWKAGEQEELTYSGLQISDDIQVDAWLGGSLFPEVELPQSNGPESVQPVAKHIRFFAHLALDSQHRYTFIWDSEGQAHWYHNGSFQNSWGTIISKD